ncbi:uncharacterized protein METZ01_LOCUS339028, partial [marine metagenome]
MGIRDIRQTTGVAQTPDGTSYGFANPMC